MKIRIVYYNFQSNLQNSNLSEADFTQLDINNQFSIFNYQLRFDLLIFN